MFHNKYASITSLIGGHSPPPPGCPPPPSSSAVFLLPRSPSSREVFTKQSHICICQRRQQRRCGQKFINIFAFFFLIAAQSPCDLPSFHRHCRPYHCQHQCWQHFPIPVLGSNYILF